MANNMEFYEDGTARGKFRSVKHDLTFKLEPVGTNWKRNINQKHPTHNVFLEVGGELIETGTSAWQKTVQKEGQNKGQTFFSIEIDDQSFAEILRVTAYQAKEGGEGGKPIPGLFNVIWRRQREERVAA